MIDNGVVPKVLPSSRVCHQGDISSPWLQNGASRYLLLGALAKAVNPSAAEDMDLLYVDAVPSSAHSR